MTINKEIAKLHFITCDQSKVSHAEQAIRAYKSGCLWVQLRMKNVSENQIIDEAMKIIPVANAHNAILLINDHPEIALKTKAHGVHLGKSDISVAEARQILGENSIIGGTANTLEDILLLAQNGVDYVGLGPYRFTITKKKLSPILGLEGYEQIINTLKNNDLHIPIIAIGGIVETNIASLKNTGIHGIALAGAIVAGNEIEINVQNFQQLINS
jgi:thiamine-phosphate pyrophosphorylase